MSAYLLMEDVQARVYYVRIHKTLKVTPGMAAGVSNRLWSIEDIVALIDARDERKSESRKAKKIK